MLNVAVMGASNKPSRYSYKAVKLLAEKGHIPLPVHPVIKDVDGIYVYKRLSYIEQPLDTITVYLSAVNSNKITDDILNSGSRRVIFNPGAENPELASKLKEKGIESLEACTLVMLKTGQF